MDELPTDRLQSADLPDPDDSIQVAEFAHTFDGYRHFGGTDAAIERMEAIRRTWEQDGTLPAEIDDLRACLFLEHRRERFVEHDDVSRSGTPTELSSTRPTPSG